MREQPEEMGVRELAPRTIFLGDALQNIRKPHLQSRSTAFCGIRLFISSVMFIGSRKGANVVLDPTNVCHVGNY